MYRLICQKPANFFSFDGNATYWMRFLMYHDSTTLMDHLITVKQYVNSSFSLLLPNTYLFYSDISTSFAVAKKLPFLWSSITKSKHSKEIWPLLKQAKKSYQLNFTNWACMTEMTGIFQGPGCIILAGFGLQILLFHIIA